MLTTDDISTICAALQFWEEEMCPHGQAGMRAYYRDGEARVATTKEIQELRQQLDRCELRYGLANLATTQLESTMLFQSHYRAQRQAAASQVVATILIPAVGP